MHKIDVALSKRGFRFTQPCNSVGHRIVSVVDPETMEKREATAFLNGFVMGVTVSHTQPVNNPERVTIAAQESRTETESAFRWTGRYLSVIAILAAVAGSCTAIGWHTSDARWEAKAIAPIMDAKERGELPPPIPMIGDYDRIKGIRK